MTTDVEKMLRDYYEVWNSHDVERITSFLADEFLYEDVPAGVAHRNKDEFKASWRELGFCHKCGSVLEDRRYKECAKCRG